jgi:hypothetical protein
MKINVPPFAAARQADRLKDAGRIFENFKRTLELQNNLSI